MLAQISDLKARFTIPDVWAVLGLPGEAPKPSRSICSPLRPDKHPSFSIYANGTKYHDFATGEGGDVLDLIAAVKGLSCGNALQWLREFAGLPQATRAVPNKQAKDEVETRRKEQKEEGWRQFWLSIRSPTLAEMESIAKLRNVSLKAVLYLVQDGLLVVGRWRHHDVWAIKSGTFAQARPMGRTHFWHDGPKTMNMCESTPPFLLAGNGSPTGTRVLLCEGPAELLSLTELEIRADDYRRQHFPDTTPYRPVAFAVASSAGSKFEGSALSTLAGRTVRILADNDAAGHNGVKHWTAALQTTGTTVDNVLMPAGNDLGEALPNMPDAFAYNLLQF